MCSDYRLGSGYRLDCGGFRRSGRSRSRFSEGIPNVAPRADIKITDPGVIVRTAGRGQGIW